ncbi:MAG TPA: hypothetical protein PLU83_14915, partial [Phycicoccus sp.]|nr:hypothetical protein [Phycicoccus sp.]
MDFRMTLRASAHTSAHASVESCADSVVVVRVRARRLLRAAELADRLAALLGTSPSSLECGGARVEDDAIVGMPPLTEGAQVRLMGGAGQATPPFPGVGRRGPSTAIPTSSSQRRGVVDLALVSGPDCGHRVALGVDPVV